jgi:hypothetical protein
LATKYVNAVVLAPFLAFPGTGFARASCDGNPGNMVSDEILGNGVVVFSCRSHIIASLWRGAIGKDFRDADRHIDTRIERPT